MNQLLDVAPIRRMPSGIRGFEHISLGGLVEAGTPCSSARRGPGRRCLPPNCCIAP